MSGFVLRVNLRVGISEKTVLICVVFRKNTMELNRIEILISSSR